MAIEPTAMAAGDLGFSAEGGLLFVAGMEIVGSAMAAADLDHDADNDLAVVSQRENKLLLLQHDETNSTNGSGDFAKLDNNPQGAMHFSIDAAPQPTSVLARDLNHDGAVDLVVLNQQEPVGVQIFLAEP